MIVGREAQRCAAVRRILSTADVGSIVGELPAGRYVTATHIGSYDEFYDSTAMVIGWATERGIDRDSQPEGSGARLVPRLHHYLNGPANVPAGQLVTRIDVKLRD